jgi:hypothetical protein
MIKSLAVLALLGLTSALPFDSVKPREVKKSKFGAMEIVDYFEKGFNKLVMMPLKPYLRDYAQ